MIRKAERSVIVLFNFHDSFLNRGITKLAFHRGYSISFKVFGSNHVLPQALLCAKLPPPFREQANVLSPKVFHPQPPFTLRSTDSSPLHQMVSLSPFMFLPKETFTVFIQRVNNHLRDQKHGQKYTIPVREELRRISLPPNDVALPIHDSQHFRNLSSTKFQFRLRRVE